MKDLVFTSSISSSGNNLVGKCIHTDNCIYYDEIMRGYFFWDETGCDSYGPYPTVGHAKAVLAEYVLTYLS